jgi:Asp-tRNA(Asn)/Glu-tRNA(Gln) amidotransferase A subunit family amidase
MASAETASLLAALAAELGGRGCTVERRVPEGFDLTAAWETFGELVQAEFGASLPPDEEAKQAAGIAAILATDAPPWFRCLLDGRARAVNATFRQHAATLTRRDALIAALEEFFQRWDALLVPVAPGPAFPHSPPGARITYDGVFCTPFSLTGHPVVVTPSADRQKACRSACRWWAAAGASSICCRSRRECRRW